MAVQDKYCTTLKTWDYLIEKSFECFFPDYDNYFTIK